MLLFMFSVCSFGQITRTFWGVTLGKSTKAQVRSMLIKKGLGTVTTKSNGIWIVAKNEEQGGKFSFGGHPWNSAVFDFYNGLLYEVIFSYTIYQDLGKEKIEEEYKSLKSSLDRKYGIYRGTTNFYLDENTYINVVLESDYLMFGYVDRYLNKKKEQSEF